MIPSRTPEAYAWMAIVQRCTNDRNPNYPAYGARGITVCAGWRDSRATFVVDMGPRPSADHSIDRKDNDGGYWCGHCDECRSLGREANCRWATRAEQARNTSRTVRLTRDGETLTQGEWADRLGIDHATLSTRVRRWGVERALTAPLGGSPKTTCKQGHALPIDGGRCLACKRNRQREWCRAKASATSGVTDDDAATLRCPCGSRATPAQWASLRVVMQGEREDGSLVACRTCPACHSTVSDDAVQA